MLIKKHDKSYIVAVEDGSSWRIWPGGHRRDPVMVATTVLEVAEIDDEFCSHVLIDRAEDTRVRAIEASEDWPLKQVRRSLEKG